MKRKLLRRVLAFSLAIGTLWTVIATMGTTSPDDAVRILQQASLAQQLVRWELGDYFGDDSLPFCAHLALRQSPILLANRPASAQAVPSTTSTEKTQADTPDEAPDLPSATLSDDLAFLDNGAPAETVIPKRKGYTVIGNVYIKNASVHTLQTASLSKGNFVATLTDKGPQVLIVHTHGSEAYTMPSGHKYKASGAYRTTDTRYNVVRVGDEIAATLSQYGISVLHDRVLHDCPSYNAAYDSSMAAIQRYLKKYPSLAFVLDIHRDAIEDSSGRQYKVVSKEEPHAAQVSLIMGSDYEAWQENLKLAVAVQQTITESFPTLMRPITLRNNSYNQEASTGSLLVEIGTAGNSLDEAIYAARLFGQGFAKTLLAK